MLSLFREFSKSRAFTVITVVFLIGFISVLQLSLMSMEGGMPDCLLMPGMSICNMTPFEHLNTWQSMFTSVPYEWGMGQIILAFSVFIFLFYFSFQYYLFFLRKVYSKQKLLYQKTPYFVTYLKEAFSAGILNPKSF